MGRKSKGKDRGYQTATEWREEGGGHKPENHVNFKSLPFSCCAVTFLPFEDAVSAMTSCGFISVPLLHILFLLLLLLLVLYSMAALIHNISASCHVLPLTSDRRLRCRHARRMVPSTML